MVGYLPRSSRYGQLKWVAPSLGAGYESIFQRYAIVDETMLTEAADKLASNLKNDVAPDRKLL